MSIKISCQNLLLELCIFLCIEGGSGLHAVK